MYRVRPAASFRDPSSKGSKSGVIPSEITPACSCRTARCSRRLWPRRSDRCRGGRLNRRMEISTMVRSNASRVSSILPESLALRNCDRRCFIKHSVHESSNSRCPSERKIERIYRAYEQSRLPAGHRLHQFCEQNPDHATGANDRLHPFCQSAVAQGPPFH